MSFWLYFSITFLAVIIFVIWLIYELSFKHIVIIRQLTNNRKFIIKEYAKEIIDKNKITWWKLKKEKDRVKKFMPVPISDSIDLTKRGKFWHETYRTDQGEYIPIVDTSKVIDLPDEVKQYLATMPDEIAAIQDTVERDIEYNKWKNKYVQDWRNENNVILPLKPFTREQRMAMANQIEKAKLDLGNDWKKDLPMYISIGAIVIMAAMGGIFGPDIIKEYTQGKKEIVSLVDQLDAKMSQRRIEEIRQYEQVIAGVQQIQQANENFDRRLVELEKVEHG